MFNIIKADFYKLWKSKILLWITLGFLGILLLGNRSEEHTSELSHSH